MNTPVNRSRGSTIPIIVAGLVGILVGRFWVTSRHSTGSALLRGFSFQAVVAKAEPIEWHVLEDRVYEPFPPLARPARTARRIVAQATIPGDQVDGFTRRFQDATAAALTALGGTIKGEVDLGQSRGQFLDGASVDSRIDLPRRYYAVGGQQGVADVWLITRGVDVTIVVAFME
jgi:hypothetical protein